MKNIGIATRAFDMCIADNHPLSSAEDRNYLHVQMWSFGSRYTQIIFDSIFKKNLHDFCLKYMSLH